MAEFFGRSMDVGYAFEAVPCPATPHNVHRKFWDALEACLAVKLCPDFGKEPSRALLTKHQAGYAFLSMATALVREIQYPSRHPMGSGNTLHGSVQYRFATPTAEVPLEPESVTMSIGDVTDFTESFEAYLTNAETITAYTIESDTGLTITVSANATPCITYRIQAVGSGVDANNGLLRVRIVATTSDGRVETRVINFNLIDTSL